MWFRASAPGSLMLLGEYAVLEGGNALVAAVNRRLSVKLIPRVDNKILISSQLGFFECDISLSSGEEALAFRFVMATLKEYQINFSSGFDLIIESEFSDQIGFASSAAVTVCVVRVLHEWLALSFSDESLILTARKIVRKVQTIGSGADVAACVLGGMVAYRAEPLFFEKLSYQPPITVVYSGYKTKTVNAIAHVKNHFAAQPELFQKMMVAIDACAQSGMIAAKNNDPIELGKTMIMQQRLMEALGVNTEELQKIIDDLSDHTYGAKISGSGLGDCVVALGESLQANQIPVKLLSKESSVKKTDVVRALLGERYLKNPQHRTGKSFAPTNIALVKYWGKRDTELNLPITSSLSISLDKKGAQTKLTVNEKKEDIIRLNGELLDSSTGFSKRLSAFLNLFRNIDSPCFDIDIKANIPVAAGLASSACGFAALVQAMNDCYGWQLSDSELSILARLGSGSASRSIWNGFVEWNMGSRDDGMDSFGKPIDTTWSDFQIGLLVMQETEKTVSSRDAMQRTVMTSPLYSGWSGKVQQDLALMKTAITNKDFELLGKTAESNAMTMHALMLSAWPPVSYALPETMAAMQKIWVLRQQGLNLYFTQDAGPNLKLLFLKESEEVVRNHFPTVDVVVPF